MKGVSALHRRSWVDLVYLDDFLIRAHTFCQDLKQHLDLGVGHPTRLTQTCQLMLRIEGQACQ